MATARVAGRYAKALLSLAQERKELDEVGKDLDTLEALFEQARATWWSCFKAPL